MDDESKYAELARMEDKNWVNATRRRVNALPADDASAMRYIFVDRREVFYPQIDLPGYEKQLKLDQENIAYVERLSPERREACFAAVLPKLAHYLELAWQNPRFTQRLFAHSYFCGPAFTQPGLLGQLAWLRKVHGQLAPYDPDIMWVATWAAYLSFSQSQTECLGQLLATAIDFGDEQGKQVMQRLVDSGNGQTEQASMGKHVIVALQTCSNPQAWSQVEQWFLEAKLQDGVRSAILKTAIDAHPQALTRILKLILDHQMVRFTSVTHELKAGFRLNWDNANTDKIHELAELAYLYLTDAQAAKQALAGHDPQKAYMVLWAMTLENPQAAVDTAKALLKHPDNVIRFASAWFLLIMQTSAATHALLDCLEDEDLQVVSLGFKAAAAFADFDEPFKPDETFKAALFTRTLAQLHRFPARPLKVTSSLWPWEEHVVSRTDAADMTSSLMTENQWDELPSISSDLSVGGRYRLLGKLERHKTLTPAMRTILLNLLADKSGMVRKEAFSLMGKHTITAKDAVHVEKLMARNAADIRRGGLKLLASQPDDQAIQSIKRLVASKTSLQRLVGLELAQTLFAKGRQKEAMVQIVNDYVACHEPLSDAELRLTGPVVGEVKLVTKLDNALDMLDPQKLTRPGPVTDRGVLLHSTGAAAYFTKLDDLMLEKRMSLLASEELAPPREHGLLRAELEAHGLIYLPDDGRADPFEDLIQNIASDEHHEHPMTQLWLSWWEQRPVSLREEDGFDVIRMWSEIDAIYGNNLFPADIAHPPGWDRENIPRFRYTRSLVKIMEYLAVKLRPSGCIDYMLDAAETALSHPPANMIVRALRHSDSYYLSFWHLAINDFEKRPRLWNDQQIRRLIEISRWVHHPVDQQGQDVVTPDSIARQHGADKIQHKQNVKNQQDNPYYKEPYTLNHSRQSISLLGHSLRLRCINEHDVLALLFTPKDRKIHPNIFLSRLTTRKPDQAIKDHPPLEKLVDQVRDRLLEIELQRGEQNSIVTPLLRQIKSVPGIHWVIRLMAAMESLSFNRQNIYSGDSGDRKSVFSNLVRISYPRQQDTHEAFAKEIKALKISSQNLIELALFAPQWAVHVEHTLGWAGFAQGAWWLHAHTRDNRWLVPHEVKGAWEAQLSQMTPLSAADLLDGAVDVQWFQSAYALLGKDKWDKLSKNAKYASSGSGHRRAQLFADAMRGSVSKADLIERINTKRHQDSLCALGLLPLASGDARQADLLDRYETIQAFLRTSKQFGSQRQASEKKAARISQDNLARTAGYPDPIRLQWAMEALAARDLAQGSIAVTAGPTTVSLTMNTDGEPVINIEKEGKPLKTLPASLKKNKEIHALKQRKTELTRQASRMRESMEQMMCHEQALLGEEIASLSAHPLMKPVLERIVFIGENIIGYPAEQGRMLADHTGKLEPVSKNEKLIIAHPHHMLKRGDWSAWQRECFNAERVQPFKQLFRELYPITQAETDSDGHSYRYEGHQVKPAQAFALLARRGWVMHHDEGVRKTFHTAKITVHLEFVSGYIAPLEVQGLTIESVHFTEPNFWEDIPLAKIPPLIYSEVMRDTDLVVSVAHRSGVDPQSTASTVQMRADLLHETLAALGISNVRIENQYALIQGRLAQYTLHLGSGQCHVLPGRSLCIIPIHAQQRGRLFLPFVDDDPKTAEVITKALLLAKDSQIKDPSILEQIRPRK